MVTLYTLDPFYAIMLSTFLIYRNFHGYRPMGERGIAMAIVGAGMLMLGLFGICGFLGYAAFSGVPILMIVGAAGSIMVTGAGIALINKANPPTSPPKKSEQS